jgi:N-methylhydantoinase A/oxoprolinase/acetone carboxylase beta subunit
VSRRILIPRDPGVGSAVGFLHAPVSFEIVRSRYATLDALDADGLNAFFAGHDREATAVVRARRADAPLTIRRTAFMRYHGQGHEIEIPLPDRDLTAADLPALRTAFEAEYARQFSRAVPGMTIEVLNWASPSPRRRPPPNRSPAIASAGRQTRRTTHHHLRPHRRAGGAPHPRPRASRPATRCPARR